jgi:hypothetical protein
MPDLWLLMASFVASAVCAAGACFVMLCSGSRLSGPAKVSESSRAVCGFASGVLAGLAVQGLRPAFPPTTALDRWLLIALPVLLLADIVASNSPPIRRSGLMARGLAAAAAVPIILFGSVHLQAAPEWSLLPGLTSGGLLITVCTCALTALVATLACIPSEISAVPRATLCVLTLQVAGLTVMLGGWVRGGAMALPFAGSCAGMLLTGVAMSQVTVVAATIRWTCLSLCGVVLLGHFFGRLTWLQAVLLLFAAVIPPLPGLCSSRGRGIFCSLLTLLILAAVLVPALAAFAERMRPLMSGMVLEQMPEVIQPG